MPGLRNFKWKKTGYVTYSQVRGKLTSLERKTIGALIVIDVHARDVVKDLADSGLTDVTDFDWISQLR